MATEKNAVVIRRTDTSGITAVLETTQNVEFYLVEEVSGYTMQVKTHTLGGALTGHFVIDQVRGRGIRAWKNAESAFRFIRQVSPRHLNVRGVFVIFRQEESDVEPVESARPQSSVLDQPV